MDSTSKMLLRLGASPIVKYKNAHYTADLGFGTLTYPKYHEGEEYHYKCPPVKLLSLEDVPESSLVSSSRGYRKSMKLYEYEMN
jgi:hypothetical protein